MQAIKEKSYIKNRIFQVLQLGIKYEECYWNYFSSSSKINEETSYLFFLLLLCKIVIAIKIY